MSHDHNVRQLITTNSKATYEYTILDTMEVGIVLQGTEVKSLRTAKANLGDSHASVDNGEVFLHNLYITEYLKANLFNHYPRRPRKLLLHGRQIRRLIGLVKKKGVTLVPLKMYFNHKNRVKILLAVAQGKKNHDKREAIKQREWGREKARILRGDI